MSVLNVTVDSNIIIIIMKCMYNLLYEMGTHCCTVTQISVVRLTAFRQIPNVIRRHCCLIPICVCIYVCMYTDYVLLFLVLTFYPTCACRLYVI